MADTEVFYLKTNNLEPAIDATLRTADGALINLGGASVRFLMKYPGATVAKADAECTILDAARGLVRHSWNTGETDVAGLFNAEFEITFFGGRKLTVPNDGQYVKVQITDALR